MSLYDDIENQKRAVLTQIKQELGSYSDIARMLKISPQAVSAWFMNNRKIPLKHVSRISEMLGVPPETIRTDLSAEVLHKKLQKYATPSKVRYDSANTDSLDSDVSESITVVSL